MPIYVYECADCKNEEEVLQKLSDAPMSECPKCGSKNVAKQLTAAGFALKGAGWYATDFKGSKVSAEAPKPATTPCGGSCACHPKTS